MTVYRPSKTVVFAALIAAATAAAPSGPIFAGEGHRMSFGHAGQPDEVDRTVRLKARDIAFDHSQIEAQPGETIRFVITNTGAMEHEFTIGPPEVQRKHRREMRDRMGSGSMQMRHNHPNAILVEAGKTKTLIWHFERIRDVKFGCNVPGHYQAGMNGTFVRSK